MASYSQQLRSGLPRVPGGEPWPPAGTVAGAAAVVAHAAPSVAAPPEAADLTPAPPAAPAVPAVAAVTPADVAPADVAPADKAPAAAAVTLGTTPLRRGLPRVAGGEPWPAEGFAPGGVTTHTGSGATAAPVAATSGDAAPAQSETADLATAAPVATALEPTAPPAAVVLGSTPLRRGLPRVSGGEPWPAEGFAPERAAATTPAAEQPHATEAPAATAVPAAATTPATPTASPSAAAQVPVDETPVAQAPVAQAPAAPAAPAAATPAQPAVAAAKAKREPRMIGSRSLSQWVKLGSLGIAGLIVLAGVIVLAARGLTTLPGVPEFVERYPGEYAPAVETDEGFPAWARWTHYLNVFFMVLIVRSGLTVRHQQKPDAFFTPKRGGKKVSIHLWLHTSIDLLWLANGIAFVVLLFVSGHWARIVPTSWEVFPNALSSMLQYLTLDWPVEDGWVNYNSLQQLMYFIIVFIAAPLAAITGVRMSEWWPKDSEKLDRVFPAPLARAIHYPTMLFFVFFVIVHVFLVLTTGALKNLNHMFAGNPGTGWFGFWMFVAGLAAIAIVWVLTRPLVIAPIASLFGKVSNR